MLEKEIEKAIVNYASSKNFLTYKYTSPQYKGVPDRLVITPTGGMFFIEFKRKGKKPTVLQQRIIDKWGERDIKVYIIDDVDKGKSLIDTYS